MRLFVDWQPCAAGPWHVQEVPTAGSGPPRFTSTALANPPALALLLALLRHASWEDQLWGLAALRELLLQVCGARLATMDAAAES